MVATINMFITLAVPSRSLSLKEPKDGFLMVFGFPSGADSGDLKP